MPSPAGTACSATTSYFLTGTDEHGLKIAAGRRGAGHHAAGAGRPRRADASRRRGSTSTSPTTTSSARPSRATTRPCRSCCSGATTTATSSSTRTSGPYCVRARRTTARASCVDGDLCPIHKPPGRATSRRRTTSSASSRFQQRLLDWYAAHPDVDPARVQAQRGARPHPLGPPRLLDHPHVARLGRARCRGTDEPRLLRLVRRADQLRHGDRLRHRRRALRRRGGRPTTTSSARTSSASTACTGRRC